MAKKVKMVIFGPPGVGKSTFAAKAPSPLFLTTDGNFEWLDLPDENNVRLSTWKQAKQVISDIVSNKPEYSKFQTIVVDLIEDLYIWLEDEFCKREGIIHIGDYKSMGAGYSVIRKEFFAQISKLLSIDRHVILISHEADKIGKTKAGADTYTYIPSDKLSLTKQWNDIEGQVRYFLRCFSQDEEVDGKVRKKRYLSLIPGQGEYGICRGADEENWPRECELDWNVFASIIGLKAEPASSKPTPQPQPAPQAESVAQAEPAPETPAKPKRVRTPSKPKAEAVTVPLVEESAPEAPASEEIAAPQEQVTPTPVETEEDVVVEAKPSQPVNADNLTPEQRRKLIQERIKLMKSKKQ